VDKIVFGIVGGGWRTEFYIRIVKAMPDQFELCGVIVRNEVNGKAMEDKFGIKTYRSIDELLTANTPSFMVVCVGWEAAPVVTKQLTEKNIPVLTETPPAPDLEGLIELNKLTDKGAIIQVAEQYHLQPFHAARLGIAASGQLGQIHQVNCSVCHGYHGMSLIRRFLGIRFENAVISARSFRSSIVKGPGRDGEPDAERLVESQQVIGTFDFGDKLGIYDFDGEQYFSWIRGLRLNVRGEKGEIIDQKIKYLLDYKTPMEIDLRRMVTGENGNLEGYYLKGIIAGENWVYKNPLLPARLSDDEIAVASCLLKMENYLHGGPELYSLAEASQDHYLSIMMNKALFNNEVVRTETQPWAQ
jgi:hypothetical protein